MASGWPPFQYFQTCKIVILAYCLEAKLFSNSLDFDENKLRVSVLIVSAQQKDKGIFRCSRGRELMSIFWRKAPRSIILSRSVCILSWL